MRNLFITVLAVFTLLPTAHAVYISTTPVTGDYIDTSTNVIHHYEASTGILTTSGEIGDPFLFQTLTTWGTGDSKVRFASTSKVTGYACFEVRIVATHSTGLIDNTYKSGTACGNVVGVVTYGEIVESNGVNYAPYHGTAVVSLYRGQSGTATIVTSHEQTY